MKQIPEGERVLHKYYLASWMLRKKKVKRPDTSGMFRKLIPLHKDAITQKFKDFLKINQIERA